jgi:hypothetical protein
MAGVLQYSLGLATSQFVAGAERARAAIGGVARTALSLPGIGAAVATGFAGFMGGRSFLDKMFEQIQQGSQLDALRRRTGEMVKDLYALRFALDEVDVGGQSAAPMLTAMQKAIGGFNEFGEPTKDVFAGMRLEVERLKGLDAIGQFRSIVTQLAAMDRATATNFAAKIFGRGVAADVMQIAGSLEEFNARLEQGAELGMAYGRNAKVFNDLMNEIDRVKIRFNGFFLGIAEGAAPGIQALVDKINSIDVTGLGKRIGDALSVGGEAWKEGQFGELVGLSLKSGMLDASNFMLTEIDKWAERIRNAFSKEKPGEASGLEQTGAALGGIGAGLLGLWNLAGEKVGIPGSAEKAEERIDQANRLLSKAGLGGFIDSFAEEMATAGGEAVRDNPFRQQLDDLYASLLAKVKAREGTDERLRGGTATAAAGAEKKRGGRDSGTGVSELERVGLLFNFGGAQASVDYQRRTAENTNSMAQYLRRISERMWQGETADFSNVA